MSDFDRLKEDLKKARDEIHLKLHLASMEAKDEWDELERKWQDFSTRAEVDKTSEGLGGAFDNLGQELKQAYTRFAGALKD